VLPAFEMGASDISFPNSSDNDTGVSSVTESIEQYLVRTLGPKHLPLVVVLPITVIYVVIFVSGIIGNVAVCVVIARNKSMRTATNYYLFSLAVSDLTLLLLGELRLYLKCVDIYIDRLRSLMFICC
jgi:hypothetical protein